MGRKRKAWWKLTLEHFEILIKWSPCCWPDPIPHFVLPHPVPHSNWSELITKNQNQYKVKHWPIPILCIRKGYNIFGKTDQQSRHGGNCSLDHYIKFRGGNSPLKILYIWNSHKVTAFKNGIPIYKSILLLRNPYNRDK